MNRLNDVVKALVPRSFLSFLYRHGYACGLGAVWMLSLILRFWSLDRFNQLAFDEVYYVRYGVDYLSGRSLFDAHPPLGKYLIAAGIWLGDGLLFSHLNPETHLFNEAANRLLSPYSYRWLNAVVGSSLPLLLAGIARQLTGQKWIGLVAAMLIALDGLFLVESRFALLHVHLVALGLLGHWCWLKAIRAPSKVRWRWLLGAGTALGACISVKWNGMGYWIVPIVFGLLGWGLKQWQRPKNSGRRSQLRQPWVQDQALTWREFSQVSPLQVLWFGVVVPGLIYALFWLPHLQLNPEVSLWKLHGQILSFHKGGGVIGANIHDYCSPWWSWPLMIRPIAYAFSKGGEPPVYFAVYALGNPLLWWSSSLAMVGVVSRLLVRTFHGLSSRLGLGKQMIRRQNGVWEPGEVGLYLGVSFGANWLPWAGVERCSFVYHYLGALSFSFIALAGGLVWAWQQRGDWRSASCLLMGITGLAFCFWLPIWLGLPLSEQALQLRLLLPSWP